MTMTPSGKIGAVPIFVSVTMTPSPPSGSQGPFHALREHAVQLVDELAADLGVGAVHCAAGRVLVPAAAKLLATRFTSTSPFDRRLMRKLPGSISLKNATA